MASSIWWKNPQFFFLTNPSCLVQGCHHLLLLYTRKTSSCLPFVLLTSLFSNSHHHCIVSAGKCPLLLLSAATYPLVPFSKEKKAWPVIWSYYVLSLFSHPVTNRKQQKPREKNDYASEHCQNKNKYDQNEL